MPANMEGALSELIHIRAVNFRPLQTDIASGDFSPLGVADSIPDFGTSSNEVFIWHAYAGILPITASEVIRFGMDAPRGFNLILSERQVQPDCHSVDTFDFRIIEPMEISKWIGQAVLSGDLTVSANEDNNSITDQRSIQGIGHSQILVLSPLLDFKTWANQRGMDGTPSSPILLNARLWTVMGDLQGPNGEIESRKWEIIEDPWSQKLSLAHDLEDLHIAPTLRTIAPHESKWLSRSKLDEEIDKIIEERRRGKTGESNSSGTVRSMLLQKWSLKSGTATINFSNILIPGWIIELNPKRVLHGRNGRLYEF